MGRKLWYSRPGILVFSSKYQYISVRALFLHIYDGQKIILSYCPNSNASNVPPSLLAIKFTFKKSNTAISNTCQIFN